MSPFRLIRMTRRAAVLSAITGITFTAVIAAVTGFAEQSLAFIQRKAEEASHWAMSLATQENLLAIGGVILIPVAIIAALLVMSEN